MNDVNFVLKKVVESNALQRLPEVFKDCSLTGKVLLVADDRTFNAAGEKVKDVLTAGGYQLHECILRRSGSLAPDERALGEILLKMAPGMEVLMAVGSGSITDLTRYISYKLNKPFIAVPTAPSMDGYASPVASLTINGFKQALPAVPPAAIVADIEILAKAPSEMILAGFGDLLGKYTSLADWKLSSVINEESYSGKIAVKVRSTVDQTVATFNSRITDLNLIKNLTEALVVSGEAMLEWGNSRPASGAEHHLAHFWEMQAALAGKEGYLHGTKVGIAVILAAGLYHNLFNRELREVKWLISQNKPETEEEYIARIKKIFGPLVGDELDDLKGYYLDQEKRAVRQLRIIKNWEIMKKWVKENVPTAREMRELMLHVGAPVDAKEIGVDGGMLRQALQNAKEVRGRYTIFRLVEDIAGNIEGFMEG
jgi:glycerol-1-phosphate dehydrogenase [NAD(P)+]